MYNKPVNIISATLIMNQKNVDRIPDFLLSSISTTQEKDKSSQTLADLTPFLSQDFGVLGYSKN